MSCCVSFSRALGVAGRQADENARQPGKSALTLQAEINFVDDQGVGHPFLMYADKLLDCKTEVAGNWGATKPVECGGKRSATPLWLERLVLRWIRHKHKPKRRRASLAAALHIAVADTFNRTRCNGKY